MADRMLKVFAEMDARLNEESLMNVVAMLAQVGELPEIERTTFTHLHFLQTSLTYLKTKESFKKMSTFYHEHLNKSVEKIMGINIQKMRKELEEQAKKSWLAV